MTLSPARRRLLSLGVGVVVGAVLAAVLLVGSSPGPTRAAAFTLPRLGGGADVVVPVVEGGHDVPLVLVFFASWCTPCQAELPVVAAVARSLAEARAGVQFVGVDGDDSPSSGLAFARQSGVRFPVAEDSLTEVAPRYGLTGYPDTVFVDAAGDVVHVVRGPVSASTLRTWAARVETRS